MTEQLPANSDQRPPQLQLWEGSSAMVEQGRHWSSALIWIGATLLGATVIWGFTAKLDQTITVRGRLVPSGAVRDVESPSAGVISQVHVREGQQVREGDPLFTVEAQGLASRRQALSNTLTLLNLQAEALKGIMASGGEPRRFQAPPALPVVQDPTLLAQLVTARQQSQQIRAQLQQITTRLESRRQTLRLQQRLANDLKRVFDNGGIARNQYLTQLNQVQETQADVAGLQEERSRVLGQTAGQLNEINRQTISLKAELVGLKETLSYRTIKAPISGKVFDNKIKRFAVINADQPLLKLVPANRLEASVEISDADIGFVEVGLPAMVAVDSFPSGEFGYIHGRLSSLGSDALPPTPQTQRYSFPATISLREQSVLSGNKKLNLQSGMGVSANIKLRSRPVITIITDMFTRQLDGVKRFR